MELSNFPEDLATRVNWPTLLAVFGLLFLSTVLAVRKHVEHPLYQFPGPVVASFSNVLHSYWFLGGRQPFKLLELHNKYGPVVRTAPNDLSFNTAASWRDIYGFRQGHSTFVKSDFYDGGVFADQAHSIISERDPGVHGEMRKFLSHAFSEKSLKAQEPLISEVIDELVVQLGTRASNETGVDIANWYNLTTFDIIGSLAFGESFGGVKSGRDPLLIAIINAIGQSALADTMNRFPFFATMLKIVMPKKLEALVEDTRTHEAYTMGLIKKRLENPSSRPDFLTRMLENKSQELKDVQIAAHASDFVIAGSETTATTLSCATYYLLKNPAIYAKATTEIRTNFTQYKDINATAVSHLHFLHAVALEAMRVYPPLPLALPRVVPKGGDIVDGNFIPEATIVSTNPLAASLSPQNFTAPMEFCPERWLEGDTKENLEATQPFSLGPRGCLGRNLAWMELGLILSKLLWTYDLRLLNKDVDWLRDSRMAMLWQKPDLLVSIEKRKELQQA